MTMEKVYKSYVTYIALTEGFNVMEDETVSVYFKVQ